MRGGGTGLIMGIPTEFTSPILLLRENRSVVREALQQGRVDHIEGASDQVTDLGKITLVGVSTRPSGDLQIRGGYGIGLNRQGQVALNVRIDGSPTTLVLLTPNRPPPGAGN